MGRLSKIRDKYFINTRASKLFNICSSIIKGFVIPLPTFPISLEVHYINKPLGKFCKSIRRNKKWGNFGKDNIYYITFSHCNFCTISEMKDELYHF